MQNTLTIAIYLAAVLLVTISGQQACQYKTVAANTEQTFTMNSIQSTTFFRFPAASSSYLQVSFSACVGLIKVYKSSCRSGVGGCDDGTNKWCPVASNAQEFHEQHFTDTTQSTYTFDLQKLKNPTDGYDYFGIEIYRRKNDSPQEVQFKVSVKSYAEDSVAGKYVNSPKIASSSTQISWPQLELCAKASGETCTQNAPIVPSYTVYASKSNKYNLGTACGLKMMDSDKAYVAKLITNQNNKIKPAELPDGEYTFGVSASDSSSFDFAYMPMKMSQSHEKKKESPSILFFLAVGAGAICCCVSIGVVIVVALALLFTGKSNKEEHASLVQARAIQA